MAVFDGVRYILSSSLPPSRRHELASILDLNGATTTGPHTHLIALGGSYSHKHNQGEESANSALKVVSDKWVDRSIVMGKPQLEQYYAPDPAMIFSGIVACATDLPASDVEVLSAGIAALGGQWRIGLTRDVTHLFALRPGSDKYNTAIHFAPHTHMSIITPHWFDDSVRLGRRLPEAPYLWPDPIVLRPGHKVQDGINDTDEKRRQTRTNGTEGDDPNVSNVGEKEQVWEGKKIFLSRSLELSNSQRDAVEAGIRRSGGVVVKEDNVDDDEDEVAEERAVGACDVFVTRWRSGKAYFKAARSSTILIGTLTWLFSVESSGTLHSPLDSLLWYPVPRGGVPGLAGFEISITNYTGAARDYLKRLITLMGGKFTPSLSVENKVLVAGFQHSPKTKRALAWSIPIVNHTWVEDCFVEWRALTVGLERYIVFPPGIDFGKLLMTGDNNGGGPANGSSVTLGAGVVPGGRGVGAIDVETEEKRDAKYERDPEANKNQSEGLHPSRSIPSRISCESGTPNRTADKDRGRKLEKGRQSPIKPIARSLSRSAKRARGSLSGIEQISQDVYVDKVVEIPGDEAEEGPWLTKSKLRTVSSNASPTAKPKSSASNVKQPPSSHGPLVGTSTSIREVEAVVTYHDDEDGVLMDSGGLGGEYADNDRMNVEEELPTKPNSRYLRSGIEPKVSSKSKGKAALQHSPGEELVSGIGEESVRRSKSRSIAKPNSIVPSTKSRPRTPNLVSEPEVQRPKLVRRNSVTSRARSTRSEVDEPPSKKGKRDLSHSQVKTLGSERKPIHLYASSDSDSEPARPARRGGAPTVTPVKSGMKPKPRSTSKRGEVEEDENSDADLYTRPNKGKKQGKDQPARNEPTTSQSRAQTSTSKSTTKHIARRSPTRSPSPASPTKAISTPKRTVSVLVPSLPKEYFTPGGSKKNPAPEDQGTDAEDPRPSQTSRNQPELLMPKPSMRAVLAEASTSAAKGGKPTLIDASTRIKAKNRRPSTSNPKTRQPEGSRFDTGDDISMIVDSPAAPVRSGPRRSAAKKATVKLREEVMPDVVNYEKERKVEKRRRTAGDDSMLSLRDEDEEDRVRGKRRKVDDEGTKGKARKTKQREGDEEAEVELAIAVPKENRNAAKAVRHQDDYGDRDERRTEGNSRSQESKARSQSMHDTDREPFRALPSETKVVRLMSTGITISDEAIKRLAKLGVRMTSKPTDCTHLVTKGIVRTEKFLCAMSVSPYILREEWANESIKSGKLLPEQDYLLSDPAAEKKWKFNFAEALERSKQKDRGSQLFKQKLFYLTPKVPIDSRLLKAVVHSAGGQVQVATPTVRILKAKDNRFVISCPEDVAIWRPLAQEGYKIYSTELILQAVLKQEIDWESPECIVDESSP